MIVKLFIIILISTVISTPAKTYGKNKDIGETHIRFMLSPVPSIFILGYSGYVEWAVKDKLLGIEFPFTYGNSNFIVNVIGSGIRINKYINSGHYGLYWRVGTLYNFVTEPGIERNGHLFFAKTMWGYKKSPRLSPFQVDIGLGLMFIQAYTFNDESRFQNDYRGIMPVFTFSIGYELIRSK